MPYKANPQVEHGDPATLSPRRKRCCFRLTSLGICLVALFFPGAAQAGSLPPAPSAMSQEEVLRLGERIYRDGQLPSGKHLQAVIKGDIAVDGRMFSCASCHRRSGLGSVEGGVVTHPNAGRKLFQPSHYGRELTTAERSSLSKHYQSPPRRPAYTEETLAQAIRNGVDPTGRVLNSLMPRFTLSDSDMAILTTYLKSLSAELSPGVSETAIRFATVVTPDVPAKDRDAMLGTLEAFVADWNSRGPAHAARARYPEIAQEADLSYRTISLARWELDGPKETWRRQLEEHYRKGPVFALLGGIGAGEWGPVHAFSEERRLPCIFPITDFPVLSDSAWYTLYFSKGLHLEGEAAAESLGKAPEITTEDAVLQVYRDDSEGRALAAGFGAAWRSLGRKPPTDLALPPGRPAPADLQRQLTVKRPQVVLLWLGEEGLPVLEKLTDSDSPPKAAYLSSSLLRQSIWMLPEQAREIARITYPYRLPQDEAMHAAYAGVWLRDRELPVDDRRITTRMYSLMLLMNEAIPKMRRNFYRDHFLEIIDLSKEHAYPDFERLSFGAGRRYASAGCYIVTLSRGPNPILLRKGD